MGRVGRGRVGVRLRLGCSEALILLLLLLLLLFALVLRRDNSSKSMSKSRRRIFGGEQGAQGAHVAQGAHLSALVGGAPTSVAQLLSPNFSHRVRFLAT